LEVEGGGEDGAPGESGGGGVEEEVSGEEAVDCGSFWEEAGEGLGDGVGGAEGGEGDG